jgi:hypothetical protein
MRRSSSAPWALLLAPAIIATFASCSSLTGCDAASLAAFGRAAAPIAADALATYQARARELAPTLPAGDPRVEDIARRLAQLEQARTRERAADDCEAASTRSSDAAALVQALEDAARAKADATRARDALAAALRAIPVAADAGAEGGAL